MAVDGGGQLGQFPQTPAPFYTDIYSVFKQLKSVLKLKHFEQYTLEFK